MKKQIFTLIVAISASVALTFGQTVSAPTGTVSFPAPRAIDVAVLTADALHPVAGTPYTYSISVPSPAGTKTFKWLVTQEQTFLSSGTLNEANAEASGGTHVATAGTELNATTAAGVGEDIVITWKSFIHNPTLPVFVVIYVLNDDGTCSTQNVKVYQIEPINSFTLDIANNLIDGTVVGYASPDLSTCVSSIASATYDATSPEGVLYDFGTDYLFYTITAANFTTSWAMTLNLTGATGTQATTVEWAYSNALTTWNAYVAGGAVAAKDGTGTVGAAGESIIVRVTVKHNKEEVLTAQNITIAVDGVSNTLPDLHYVDGLADGFVNDLAIHTMKPRPTIQSTTVGAGVDFLPKK